MPFLHLFAKGAQVLNAGLPFHLEDRHFAKWLISRGLCHLLPRLILRYYLKYYLSIQYTMSTNNLCHETCRIVFIKMTAKSKFLLARPKMAQMVKMPFIVFHLARLIFTGQTSHLDMIYPWHISCSKTFCLLRDSYSRRVMTL